MRSPGRTGRTRARRRPHDQDAVSAHAEVAIAKQGHHARREALAFDESGWPLWRSVVLICPRKNGKTALLAALSLYRLLLSPADTPVSDLMAPTTVRVRANAPTPFRRFPS